jgi:acetyltransferase-like isoleucine patch superfamily enzyme
VNTAATTRTGKRSIRTFAKRVAVRLIHLHIPVGPVGRRMFGILYRAHVAGREGMIWLLRFIWYEPLFRSRCERVGERLQMEELPYITGAGRIVVGSDVWLSGKSTIGFGNRVHDLPELVIGDHTFVGHNCSFLVAQSVTIGKHCLLAGGVRVSDFDGHHMDAGARRRKESMPASGIRPVVIGDDAWIGAGVYILKGVRIGERAIIGAGAVVTADVPAGAVAAGNPARIIRQPASLPDDRTP